VFGCFIVKDIGRPITKDDIQIKEKK